jgi:hypothetical protein
LFPVTKIDINSITGPLLKWSVFVAMFLITNPIHRNRKQKTT